MPLVSDKSNGFTFKPREELRSGAWPENFSTRIPFFRNVSNVEFTEQGVKKIQGWQELSDLGDATEPIRGLQQVLDGTSRLVYAGNLSNLFEITEGVSASVGSGYTGQEDSTAVTTTWDTATDTGTTFAATASGFTDSGNGFVSNGVLVGQKFTVSGFATASINNTVYTIDTVVAGTVTTTPNPPTTEAAGATVTYLSVTTWDSDTTIWDSAVVPPTQWSMVNFGLFVLATNGVDAPQIFKGASFAALTGLPTTIPVTTFELFAKRNAFVIGLNTNVDSRQFHWSDIDDPETWEPTVSNAAGDLLIRELKTPIRAAVSIGDRIAVYGDDQMFLINFVGAPLYFGYQPALDGIGAVSKHAIVPVGRRNFGWSQQGFFVTDGVSFEYIDDPQVRRFINNNASLSHLGKVNGYHDEQNNQVRWYYATSSGKCDAAVIYNYRSDTWSLLDIGRSASSERLIYPNALSGAENSGLTSDGKVFFENITQNNDEVALVAFARTKGLDLGDVESIKEIDSIRIGTSGTSQGLQFRLGWSEDEDADPDTEIIWDDFIAVPNGYDFTNVRTAGRFLFIELFSDALNANWEVPSIDIVGRFEGSR